LGKFGIHHPPVETGGYSRSTPTAFSLKFMTLIKKQFTPLENKKIRERLPFFTLKYIKE
jgi:hypothetical protein